MPALRVTRRRLSCRRRTSPYPRLSGSAEHREHALRRFNGRRPRSDERRGQPPERSRAGTVLLHGSHGRAADLRVGRRCHAQRKHDESLTARARAPLFNSVIVSDACCPFVDLAGPWYATVTTLPSDLAWRQAYEAEFGTFPTAFADLCSDAASLLIRDLQAASRFDASGDLVINRAALAQAVRNTTNYQGVTCTIALDPTTGLRINDPAALARCAEN